jgi:pyridoxine/pyridoxamine 5'-phosphate oxidase
MNGRARLLSQEDAEMETKNLDIYGHAPLPWSRARNRLDATRSETGHGSSWFLTTVRPDGRPHSAGVGVFWDDEKLWFTSGPRTRKSRDIAKNANVVLSVALKGLDLVVEGTVARVTDAAALERLAKIARDQGWPARVEGDALTAAYSAPSAGRPPWYVYVVTPVTAFGVATEEPNGATRWRFG